VSDDAGFLSRWSRRKAEVKRGMPVAEPAAVDRPTTPPFARAAVPATLTPGPLPQQVPPPPPAGDEAPAAEPLPTLDDVAALDPKGSDFARFMTRSVDPDVKNAALKKLFTDPHFNVMDGLDIYIDDYGKPDPIPASMLRQMAQSKFLGLFDDEAEAKESPKKEAGLPAEHENPDLRLQPDDAAGQPGAEPGPDEDPGRER
jgi:hypothetical protein